MTLDPDFLKQHYSKINQDILERGQYSVSPDREFDYLQKMQQAQTIAERLRRKSLQQSVRNSQIQLANQFKPPPRIKFPRIPKNLPVARGGGSVGRGGFSAGNNEMMQIAAIIANKGSRLGATRKDIITAITAGLVESNLRNVNFGDRDSLGVFQQRAPWAPAKARLNPRKSAAMFFLGGRGGQEGLLDIRDRHGRPIGVNAQDVQVSAYPGRYGERVKEARRIYRKISRRRRRGARRG